MQLETEETGIEGFSTPLQQIYLRSGAVFGELAGRRVVMGYGDPAEEQQVLEGGIGWLDLDTRDLLEMAGEDRQRFLNGLVTCEVKTLEVGQGAYGFVTTAKGKILADLLVLATEDRFLLSVPAGSAEEVAAHLGKYIIVDRVVIQPVERPSMVDFVGPRCLDLLAALGGPGGEIEKYSHGLLRLGTTDVRWVRGGDLAGLPRWSLWLPRDHAAAGLASVLALGSELGLRPIGRLVYERRRIAAGEPIFGLDFGPENFPQETGLSEAVSFTKGCYLGQEVVARIHYRGGVNRFLRGLLFSRPAGEEPALGSAVDLDGREVGRLTSLCRLGGGSCLGLGILHKRAEHGAEVELAGGGVARVVELPVGPQTVGDPAPA